MWPTKLLLFLLVAACVSLDLALWASYPQPRTEFPTALLALLISQTTLLTLWAVYGRGSLWLRLPAPVAMLVVLTAIGDRLQLWGPRDSMRLFDTLVLVIGAKLTVMAGALMLLRSTMGLHLMQVTGASPLASGGEKRAVRVGERNEGVKEVGGREESESNNPFTATRGGDERAARAGQRNEGMKEVGCRDESESKHPSPSGRGGEGRAVRVAERFVIEETLDNQRRSSHQFSLTWLFSLVTGVALTLMLLRFVPLQLPCDADTITAMLRSSLLFVVIAALLLWAVLPARLCWTRLIVVLAGIGVVYSSISQEDHPLAIDSAVLATWSAIPLAFSLAVVRISGFRMKGVRD